eukprot:gb/GECH01000877.1/.p1 GENE.gb/GECH01000877.1/~~gb/GECH01000877.1/.p1  ORF type:complete len:451 (+),score=48.54 gb/GECH01000877.1/:1-1353(+)
MSYNQEKSVNPPLLEFPEKKKEEDPHEEQFLIEESNHDLNNKYSAPNALYNIVCSVAGSGILQLPKAISHGGWISLGILVLLSFQCCYTGKKLVQCMTIRRHPDHPLISYQQIGEAAFGRIGSWITLFFQIATLSGGCTLYLILLGTNMHEIFPVLETHIWIMIATAILLPMTWLKSMKEVSLVSMLGMAASAFTVVVVVVLGTVDKTDLKREASQNVSNQVVNVSWNGIPQSFAGMAFSFGGHSVFPKVAHTMKKPQQFNRVANFAFLSIAGLYIPVAIVGYWVYGDSVKSPILQSLPQDWVNTIANVLITLHIAFAYPIIANPIFAYIENAINMPRREHHTPNRALILRLSLRSIVVFITMIIAITVPFFGEFLSFIGAFSVTAVVFILPVVFTLRLTPRNEIGWFEYIWMASILLVGTVGSIIGSITAVQAIIVKFEHASLSWRDIF